MSYFESPEKILGPIGSFFIHVTAVYFCAIHLSPWMVGRYFAWIEPSLNSTTRDWYIQHLEIVTIFPALIVGYIVALHFNSTPTWAWTAPTVALIYRIVRYSISASVLGGSVPALKYFFDIQHIMPTFANMSFTDPIRVWAQMTITAPFYAGLAYSSGAFMSKRKLIPRLWDEWRRTTLN
ncbi:MAG TPA: hypothetical protein VN684_10680 [Terriglobales bacterium]|nr:hypothetical protein [Terriglobales bacterium]